jgi:hypothetical protein
MLHGNEGLSQCDENIGVLQNLLDEYYSIQQGAVGLLIVPVRLASWSS